MYNRRRTRKKKARREKGVEQFGRALGELEFFRFKIVTCQQKQILESSENRKENRKKLAIEQSIKELKKNQRREEVIKGRLNKTKQKADRKNKRLNKRLIRKPKQKKAEQKKAEQKNFEGDRDSITFLKSLSGDFQPLEFPAISGLFSFFYVSAILPVTYFSRILYAKSYSHTLALRCRSRIPFKAEASLLVRICIPQQFRSAILQRL